jgi:myo-inositol-1-phosphate synthase
MIKVAIIGIGNCASALIQGIAVAKAKDKELTGLTYKEIGGYKPEHIDVVCGFDIDKRKIGYTIGEAIYAHPNCCFNIAQTKQELNMLPSNIVKMVPVLDGISPHMLVHPNGFQVSDSTPLTKDEIVNLLLHHKVDVVVNYLPVGSQEATEFWAQICLDANISFCNCIPVFIASDPIWEQKFIEKKLPLIGDDMRSQFGASVLSQMFQELAFDRGHQVTSHIQQNVGGNTDFLNMTDKSRLTSKKISKENVIRSQNDIRHISTEGSFLYAGPSDYISYYGDNKIATFHLELKGFGGAPVVLDAKLSVEDSPNSAGVVIDAIRFLKVAKEMGICGSLRGASAFTQKTPPEQLMFSDAKYECDSLSQRKFTDKTIKQKVE